MSQSIDELYARWKQNPDPAQTAALCEALQNGQRPDLVEVVGSHASRQADVPALVAAARMYSSTGRLDDAQTVLLTAGRLAPHDGTVYRWLGEVLLRRGDAERAAKVLERALQFGAGESTPAVLERARSLIATQRSSGVAAVAEAVARSGVGASSGGRAAPVDDVQSMLDAALGPDAAQTGSHGSPLSDHFFASQSTMARGPQTGELESFLHPNAVLSDPAPRRTSSRSEPIASAATAAFVDSAARAPRPIADAAPLPKVEPPRNPLLDAPRPAPAAQAGAAAIPEPRDVLEALQIAGIYEPSATAGDPIVWSKPERVRKLFSTVALIALANVLIGAGIGTYKYVTNLRAKQHLEAEALITQVDKDLDASEIARLEPAEKSIGHAFELESRSSHAALTWLHERALVGLLKGGGDIAFEDAIQRAKTVGVDEKQIAFARVASFLFQGDTAGAAATIAKWDSVAQTDAWFQLVSGAAFEHAGDVRAIERYSAAVKLAPDLVAAQSRLARAMAIDGEARRAAELAKEFRTKYPARAEGAALVALAWSRDPFRGEEPPEVKEVTDKADGLPLPLRSVPHATKAILALHKGALDEARPSLQRGLELSDTPGTAAWIGGIALLMGDETIARKAALTAVSFSAVYPPARVLAARVALLGARLDEALKAAEDLPPTSVDVAMVTAAVAYEKLDSERLARAFDPVSADAKKQPFASALVRGQSLLAGNLAVLTSDKVKDMSDDEAPWADLVAMDWALDSGDLALAKKVSEGWRAPPQAMRAVRLARLARYDGRLEEADKLSRAALDTGTVTMRALTERVFTLVALKKDGEAQGLFKTYPNVGGPLAKWLRAYATASHGKIDEARAVVSQEDPPPAAAAMPARVIAAAAFAAMKDTRKGNEYVRAILSSGFSSPDVTAAAEKVGAPKPPPRRR